MVYTIESCSISLTECIGCTGVHPPSITRYNAGFRWVSDLSLLGNLGFWRCGVRRRGYRVTGVISGTAILQSGARHVVSLTLADQTRVTRVLPGHARLTTSKFYLLRRYNSRIRIQKNLNLKFPKYINQIKICGLENLLLMVFGIDDGSMAGILG